VFDDYLSAQRAVEQLTAAGFPSSEIEINSANTYAEETGRGAGGLSGQRPADYSGGGIGGFFRRLFGSDLDEDDRTVYSEVVQRGGAVVCVTTSEDDQDRAAEILNQSGAVDIDHHVSSWRQRGETYSDERRTAGHFEDATGERTIPVVQEELRVGKRAIHRGGVRVYNRVVEEPVEEQVNLREEHVTVDRRRVDRPASEADIRDHDEAIEVTEMAEEPVIDKRTRVIEEVVVGKEATERTETVRDTLRRSDVNVERIAGEATDDYSYDDDFRADFRSRFGKSSRYETYAPAYQYGYRMAGDERYRGRSWNEVESTLRSDYERSYPDSKWEQMKDAVRYGWERMTGRR
jgi:uncharacterized protein (TIGR02271 family)